MTPEFKKETITPEKAAEYLALNFADNRKLRPAVVDQYAADMKAGRWIDTGEPIRFDEYGNLIDGQFRLSAIVQSGVTVEMWVVRGLSEGAQLVIDTGQKRSPADAMRIAGVKGYEAARAALATRIILFKGGMNAVMSSQASKGSYSVRARRRPSIGEITEYVKAHPELLAICEVAIHLYSKQLSRILVPTDYGFALWFLQRISAHRAQEFLTMLALQEGLPPGEHPARSLFKRLQGKVTQVEKLQQIEAAFRAFLVGHTRYQVPQAVKAAPAPRQAVAALQA